MTHVRPSSMQVKLSKRGFERWKNGHPWIYQIDVHAPKTLKGGEVVQVVDNRQWLLGQAYYSKESKIALRWLTWDDTAVDQTFFRNRIHAAAELRRTNFPDADAYRVVHGEADLLPGLVVDRYGEYLSIQFLNAGMQARQQLIVEALEKEFSPKGIMNRSDVGVRLLEGLASEKGLLRGQVPETVIYHEGHIKLEANLEHGQKTGSFLDQQENHVTAGQYAHGEVLDCFSYVGGFALQSAAKASKVTAVEISDSACAQIKKNADRNQITNIEVIEANVFDFLRDALDEGKKFDTIILDPPAFAKNKTAVEAALRGYKEINLRAMQLLRPGGTLISASCTHHLNEEAFETMLDSAAADAKRRVQIVEKRGASRDHPVLLSLRETRYLKCFFMKVS